MINTTILSYVTFIYFIAFCFYLLFIVMRRPPLGMLGTLSLAGGIVLQTIVLIMRWVESYQIEIGYGGHAPLSNLYESLIFFSWTIAIIYFVIELRLKNKAIGAFILPVTFLLMAYASFSPGISDQIKPLVPALQSNWLISHVMTCFLGYAAFAVSFSLSVMYLLKYKNAHSINKILKIFPERDALDILNYQVILIGLLMLTLGIITGSVWAHNAWGTYWSWDPKETWSLITWLVYAIILHTRFSRGWDGKRIAIMSIIGFCCVLFTYLGVNFLLAGLHSYGSSI